MNKKLKIVIVGGGTAGWFSAGYLVKQIKDCEITLIESPGIPKIGVGESITPHIASFFAEMGIKTKDWMYNTGAIYKFANKFVGWREGLDTEEEHFSFSFTADNSSLYKEPPEVTDTKFWPGSDVSRTTDILIKMYNDGEINKFDRYFNSQYHYMKKNVAPFNGTEYMLNPLWSWSQHINAEKAGDYIRDTVAIPSGVTHIQQKVTKVVYKDNTQVDELILENNEKITGDLFIDASGFHRLIVKQLGWKEKAYDCAPVRSAWVCQLDYEDHEKEMVNYTQSIAKPHGWMFKIGLWHRMGTGYCYAPDYVSDQDALDEYMQMVNHRRMEPRNIKWTPSRLEKMGQGNVVAIGLSAGFVEPMEANALYIIMNTIRRLCEVIWDRKSNNEFNFDTFNEKIAYSIDDIADFIKVHYTLSSRTDTKFWQDMREIGIKEKHKEMLLQKYNDPRNSMAATTKGWSLFPDYMWAQLAISWGIDTRHWVKNLDSTTYELGKLHFKTLEKRHSIISDTKTNNYSWLKQHIYDLDSASWEHEFISGVHK